MPLKWARVAEDLSADIRRLAELVGGIGGLQAHGRVQAQDHPELKQVTAAFERINQTLEKAVAAGRVTPAQQRAIARQFAAIAKALEKGAGSAR